MMALQALIIFVSVIGATFFIGQWVLLVERGLSNPAHKLGKFLLKFASAPMQAWQYLGVLFVVSGLVAAITCATAAMQQYLPYNPLQLPGLDWLPAIHLGLAVATHTNLQPFAPESSLSLFTQTFAVGVGNILIGAVGIAAWLAVVRALLRQPLGNAWAAIVQGILILLPLQFILAAVLASQGVAINFYDGPVALFAAGSIVTGAGAGWVGTGFTSAIQNPNFITDIASLSFLVGVPMAFWWVTGHLLKRMVLFSGIAAGIIIILAIFTTVSQQGLAGSSATSQALWLNTTAGSGNGSLNAPIEKFSSSGILPAFLTLLAGLPLPPPVGFGVGLVLIYFMSAVYLACLMVGRSPSFMGFKITVQQLIPAAVAVLGPQIIILMASAFVLTSAPGLQILNSQGAQGASALLWMLGSSAQNNGSAYQLTLTDPLFLQASCVLMLLGRLMTLGGILLWAGQLGKQKDAPVAPSAINEQGPVMLSFWLLATLAGGMLSVFPLILLGPILTALK